MNKKATAKQDSVSKHPEMMDVKVIFTNGEEMMVKMCTSYGKDTLYLQSDILSHRAWQVGKAQSEFKGSRAVQFSKRYPKLNL